MQSLFHPLTYGWFRQRFGKPTEPQALGWPAIASGKHTLISAPTGSGKTLAAFLSCLDSLVKWALAGKLNDQVYTVYVSPLRALSNDIQHNLEDPLSEIVEHAWTEQILLPEMRVLVRTGDTPQSQRRAMVRKPPHILVTTPESLYILLTSVSGRRMLGDVRHVIVDEIHALAQDRRGAHLALSLERLDDLCAKPPTRIGLSATQHPIESVASFLVGSKNQDRQGNPDCCIINTGHMRETDMAIEVPASELSTVCSHEQWAEVYQKLADLIRSHRSTLVFVNTRRLAERVAHQLRDLLGEEAVASHHGSLSREIRLSAESRLKQGDLKAVVATASLELGIDIGFVDLVCQIGSPRSLGTFLQRVGRSGHSLRAIPKGRLLPLSRGELLECMALIRGVRSGRLDHIEIPESPLDILAQQIVAEVSCQNWNEEDLYELYRGAWPYRNLEVKDFEAVLQILDRGIAPGKTRRGAYLHRDRIHRRLRGRRGARIAAVTSGGAIPEMAEFRVVTSDDRTYVGSVNEDFAIESTAGDIFLLGNTSWRVRHVRRGEVVVDDAHGAPASIPFWFGEAPARSTALSLEYMDLCEKIGQWVGKMPTDLCHASQARQENQNAVGVNEEMPVTELYTEDREGVLPDTGSLQMLRVHENSLAEFTPVSRQRSNVQENRDPDACVKTIAWLQKHCRVDPWGATQAINYVASQQAALGVLPGAQRIVFERFFDESGGMQLVVHAPFGARITRAWGLALRKRFCRTFNFELQASADDNGLVLSLSNQHSFPLEEMFGLVKHDQAREILIQAVLAVPFFNTRWRWNCNRALAVLRFRGGKRIPPQLQRMQSDDLLAAVFPHQVACLENIVGDIQVPDHPMVQQTLHDCLHEVMDLEGWLRLLKQSESGNVQLIARDSREPSPFSYELLNANPYAFLDDAPLEERRTRAVATRRSLSPDLMRDLGKLDVEAIELVRREAWPVVRDPEELHDALLTMVVLPVEEVESDWFSWFDMLVQQGRGTVVEQTASSGEEERVCVIRKLWIASENWPLVQAALPGVVADPYPKLPPALQTDPDASHGWVELVRGRLQVSGPVTSDDLAKVTGLKPRQVQASLEALEGEGFVLRGHWAPLDNQSADFTSTTQWCQRRLLARIHRLTLQGLRRQIEPVSPADFFRFFSRHTGAYKPDPVAEPDLLWHRVCQLAGFETSAGAWEEEILPLRVDPYRDTDLDRLTYEGRVVWGRLRPPKRMPHQRTDRGSIEGQLPSPGSKYVTHRPLTRSVPLSLFPRSMMSWISKRYVKHDLRDNLGSSAACVRDVLDTQGALFFDDLVMQTELLPGQVEIGLSELCAIGMVTADSFQSVRQLIAPETKRGRGKRRKRGRTTRQISLTESSGRFGPNRATQNQVPGRWSLLRLPKLQSEDSVFLDNWAWLLLQRYGVVFRDLLIHESLAPAWSELVKSYRRLEAQGEVRGGRFVSGVGGEQYALDDSVSRLRRVRDMTSEAEWLIFSAADPLNLTSSVIKGPRIPALHTNRLACRNGKLIAARVGGEIKFYEEVDLQTSNWVRQVLERNLQLRRQVKLLDGLSEDVSEKTDP